MDVACVVVERAEAAPVCLLSWQLWRWLLSIASEVEVLGVSWYMKLPLRGEMVCVAQEIVVTAGVLRLGESIDDLVRHVEQIALCAQVGRDGGGGHSGGVTDGGVAEGDGAEIDGEGAVVVEDGCRKVGDVDAGVRLADEMDALGAQVREARQERLQPSVEVVCRAVLVLHGVWDTCGRETGSGWLVDVKNVAELGPRVGIAHELC